MITLHRLGRPDLGRLAGLRVQPGQEGFVGDGALMIRDSTEGLSFHEVRNTAGRAVGMFKLDPLYHQRHEFARSRDLGLRGFLIDANQQGRGLGGAALSTLPAHIRKEYPDFDHVVLTVNLKNPVARHAYLKAGFADRGEVYLGGSNGPQHVLWLDLDRATAPVA